jgi:hypothetical protein
LRIDRIELLRSGKAIAPDVDSAVESTAKQPILEQKTTFSWKKVSGPIQRKITIGLLVLRSRQEVIVGHSPRAIRAR